MIKQSSLKKIIIVICLAFMTNSLFALSMQSKEYLRKARNYLNIKNYKRTESYFSWRNSVKLPSNLEKDVQLLEQVSKENKEFGNSIVNYVTAAETNSNKTIEMGQGLV